MKTIKLLVLWQEKVTLTQKVNLASLAEQLQENARVELKLIKPDYSTTDIFTKAFPRTSGITP